MDMQDPYQTANKRDPNQKPPTSNFLSLFENEDPHAIDLAYLDSVLFQPIAHLNADVTTAVRITSTRHSPFTNANAPPSRMNENTRYSPFGSYSNRALDLERERNGNF